MAHSQLEFYKALFEERDPARLQRLFLKCLLALQNVERGSLWVLSGNQYECVEAIGPQSDRVLGMCISKDQTSVVGWVIENGAMTIAEPGKDSRHYAAVEDMVEKKSTLILSFPMLLRDGSVYGAVEIIDTSAAGDKLNLDPDYLALLEGHVAIGSIALSNSLDFTVQQRENIALQHALDGALHEGTIIGRSQSLQTALTLAQDYARTDFPVLITGESGTGKELFAREIHRLSPRAKKPFFAQNCSAIPETLLESELFGYKKGAFTGATKDKCGLFEAADGGVVFLDEIGDMPVALQARILRVLQDQEIKPLGANESVKVNVRILSATNKDLPQCIREGSFREDLYYRLNVLPLRLPPLRERREDIPLLLRYFLARESRNLGITPPALTQAAMSRLSHYPWRGNIREMENSVKLLLTTTEGGSIDEEDLQGRLMDDAAVQEEARIAPDAVPPHCEEGALPLDLASHTWESLERSYVLALMEHTRWNVSKAATMAGVNRSTFDSRMRKLGIRK